MTDADIVDAGDVVVVGAGFSGLLAARALADAGYAVTLVEEGPLGGGQSAHSHGYLHRGFIYLRPSDTLVRLLQPAAARWEALLAEAGVPGGTTGSLIGFANEREADDAFRHWELSGLQGHRRVSGADVVSGVRVADALLGDGRRPLAVSPERALDFSPYARHAVAGLDGRCAVVRGRAVRLVDDGRRIGGVVVRRWGAADVRLVAGLYVVAAGAGSRRLVEAGGRHPGPLAVRRSHMLCLRHPHLPPVSAVFPGESSYGLFLAPRRDEATRATVWLLSDHVSYAGLDHDPVAVRLWLRHVVRTLTRRSSALDLDGLEWAWYPAPKAELRAAAALGGPALDSLGWANAAVANPTKLTLVPELVDQVVRWVAAQRLRPGGAGAPAAAVATRVGAADVAPERWRSCAWHPVADLQALVATPAAAPLPAWR